MNDVPDKVNIWINRDDTQLQGSQALWPVLQRLENSFLARPGALEVTGLSDRPIKSYVDDAVKKALDRRKHSVDLLGDGVRVGVTQMRSRTAIGVEFPSGPPASEIRRLFLDLIAAIKPTYARAHLSGHAQELFEKYYKQKDRSFYANGLYWLNFFGCDEEVRQGRGLDQNPHAHVERLPHGLLIEVGSSPQEAATPEGERRLLAATAALPPMPSAEALPEESEKEQPAPTKTVNGVRGFLDAADHSFWVTKHLGPDEELDPKTIEKLRRLIGQGSPTITGVHVLFSDQASALKNQGGLTRAKIRVWYVDPATGVPTEA